jgi:hypothetical protein
MRWKNDDDDDEDDVAVGVVVVEVEVELMVGEVAMLLKVLLLKKIKGQRLLQLLLQWWWWWRREERKREELMAMEKLKFKSNTLFVAENARIQPLQHPFLSTKPGGRVASAAVG